MWLPAMVVSELAPVWLVVGSIVGAVLLALGGGSGTLGAAGIVLFGLSEVGLLVLIGWSHRSAREAGHEAVPGSAFLIGSREPGGVVGRTGVEYWDDLTLDLRAPSHVGPSPTLLYLHPGSWMRGRPGRQARPMVNALLAAGWVVLDVTYPLSPQATFPEHLIGVKRAISWARTAGADHGIDPDRIAIAGASAGAHLAALAALTWDDPSLQPGFEEADTSVAACVPFYGIYDLLVRNATRYDWPFIARHVLKATPQESPELYALGSPIDQVRSDAPPFLVIHGAFDSVVLCDESRHFVAQLEDVDVDVEYLEVSHGQHGFDAFSSLRSRAVGEHAARWLIERLDPSRGAAPPSVSESGPAAP
jgi:acetyl esterase/lipase